MRTEWSIYVTNTMVRLIHLCAKYCSTFPRSLSNILLLRFEHIASFEVLGAPLAIGTLVWDLECDQSPVVPSKRVTIHIYSLCPTQHLLLFSFYLVALTLDGWPTNVFCTTPFQCIVLKGNINNLNMISGFILSTKHLVYRSREYRAFI